MATLNVAIKIGAAIDNTASQSVGANAAYNIGGYTVPANSYLEVTHIETSGQNLRYAFPGGNVDVPVANAIMSSLSAKASPFNSGANPNMNLTKMILPAGTQIRTFGANGIFATTHSVRIIGVLFSNTQ